MFWILLVLNLGADELPNPWRSNSVHDKVYYPSLFSQLWSKRFNTEPFSTSALFTLFKRSQLIQVAGLDQGWGCDFFNTVFIYAVMLNIQSVKLFSWSLDGKWLMNHDVFQGGFAVVRWLHNTSNNLTLSFDYIEEYFCLIRKSIGIIQ